MCRQVSTPRYDNASIASSSPRNVSGYILPSSSSRGISIDADCRQCDCRCGLIQANFGKCLVNRCSQTLPGSAFQCATLPPGCVISYGLMVASPTRINL